MSELPRSIGTLRAAQAAELDDLIRELERTRRAGEVRLPPTPRGVPAWLHTADTAMNRWACARAMRVEGWILPPDPDRGDPGLYQPPCRCSDGCPLSIVDCDGYGCREAGACLRSWVIHEGGKT